MGIATSMNGKIIFSWEEVSEEALGRWHLSLNVKKYIQRTRRRTFLIGGTIRQGMDGKNGKYIQGPIIVLLKCKKGGQ